MATVADEMRAASVGRAPKLLDTKAAAARLGVNQQRVRALLGTGRIPEAQHVGGVWVIPERAVERFAAMDRPPGRPRNAPRS